jgi:hypothetical protein
MLLLLQANGNLGITRVLDKLPTFKEIIQSYGPILTVILAFVIAILLLQHLWYSRVLKAKDEEIKRLVERERELYNRLFPDKD